MAETKITRIYLREQEYMLEKIINYLKIAQIRGYTVFEAVAGCSGAKKSSNIDFSLVVEFFDSPHKIENVIHELQKIVKPEHIVSWMAEVV